MAGRREGCDGCRAGAQVLAPLDGATVSRHVVLAVRGGGVGAGEPRRKRHAMSTEG